jgi:hypothetical protein
VTLSVTGPAELSGSTSGSTLTITGAGTITITANQAGNFAYASASTSAAILVNQATPAITWPTPGPIIYGTPLSATQLSASAPVDGVFAYSVDMGGDETPLSAGTVLHVGNWTLNAKFTPADSSNYATATASVTLVVRQAIPEIIWNPPSPIVYGTALSVQQLNAASGVGGSFAYSLGGKTVVTGDVLDAGTYMLTATLTPASADYLPGGKQVQLIVSVAPTAVTLTADSPNIPMLEGA